MTSIWLSGSWRFTWGKCLSSNWWIAARARSTAAGRRKRNHKLASKLWQASSSKVTTSSKSL